MSAPAAAPTVAVLVGNPRTGSRTTAVAAEVAAQIAAAIGGAVGPVVELAEHGGAVLDPGAAAVTADTETIAAADVLVVASPTYKATYTGLLKAFLDRYRGEGLSGVVAVGVMVGGNHDHALAPELHLRPLLVELGTTAPTRMLYVCDSELDRLGDTVAQWLDGARAPLRAAVSARL